MKPPRCPDCQGPTALRHSRFGSFFGCLAFPSCRGSISCGPEGQRRGRPANAATRRARIRAHQAFDQLWKRYRMDRSDAYRWLARRLGLSGAECHIALFDLATCERVVALCQPVAEFLKPAPRA